MKVQQHAALSAIVGVLGIWAGVDLPAPLTMLVAITIGVGIDLDHFILARYNSGDWAAARNVLTAPRRSFTDQASIFAEDELTASERMRSHVVIATLVTLTAFVAPIHPSIAWLVGGAFGMHIAADLYADKVWGGIGDDDATVEDS